MRDIMLAIFQSPKVENGMNWLSGWHLAYLVALTAVGVVGALILKKTATVAVRDRVLRLLAYAVPALYIADFFIMPLSNPSHSIDVMKLPFHICTFLSFFIPLAQFHPRFQKVRDVIAAITLVCSTLYLIYPGTAMGFYKPYSYLVIQTFLYHGAMFVWAWISIANDAVTLHPKNLWKAAVAVV
ncbi:MAG: hypothetical protein IKV35_00215, partial [Clostridia bacterium]|nr:hypothetical protein [Clostridia bacterium]